MVFDTIAANVGHLIAACIIIQEKLDKQLLRNACSYHIGVILLFIISKDLNIEVSKSPKRNVFSRFREHFDVLAGQSGKNLPFASHDQNTENVISFCRTTLANETERRGNYEKLLQLV